MASIVHHGEAARGSDKGALGRIAALLLSPAARPLRAVGTGGFAALIQLGILAALSHQHWMPVVANAVALISGTQVNFALSYRITWYDRRPHKGALHVLLARWIAYQCSNFGTAFLNLLLFIVVRATFPTLVAAAIGTAVIGIANFLLNDHLVFRVRRYAAARPEAARHRSATPRDDA